MGPPPEYPADNNPAAPSPTVHARPSASVAACITAPAPPSVPPGDPPTSRTPLSRPPQTYFPKPRLHFRRRGRQYPRARCRSFWRQQSLRTLPPLEILVPRVSERGLEPLRPMWAQGPQPCASTSSATPTGAASIPPPPGVNPGRCAPRGASIEQVLTRCPAARRPRVPGPPGSTPRSDRAASPREADGPGRRRSRPGRWGSGGGSGIRRAG
jgi:hypothetical protein